MAAVRELDHFKERIEARSSNRQTLMAMEAPTFIAAMERWRDQFRRGAAASRHWSERKGFEFDQGADLHHSRQRQNPQSCHWRDCPPPDPGQRAARPSSPATSTSISCRRRIGRTRKARWPRCSSTFCGGRSYKRRERRQHVEETVQVVADTGFRFRSRSRLSAQPAQQDFPEGTGKQIFLSHCGACHDLDRARAGYTPEGWRTVMRMMLNFDVPVPPDQVDVLTDYLIKSFPERPRPAAVVIDGPVQASIKLWPVPTPGSRPHDPMAARDGSIWYTGQLSGKLGRVDPKTSADQGIPGQDADRPARMDWRRTRTATSGSPAIIRASSASSTRSTGNVTEYRMPDPKARDPHTIAVDPNGTVWFTLQNANMVGPNRSEIGRQSSSSPRRRRIRGLMD